MSDEIQIEFVEQLKCSVCQDTIVDARILPCGHTQCKKCIDGCVRASDFGGLLECPECKHSAPVANVEKLPRCAVITDLLGKIDTKSSTVDPRSPVMQSIFKCLICDELLDDARSMPCGQSYCKRCLQNSSETINCRRCRKYHELPGGGVDALPVSFRINGIVEEIKSGGKKKTRPRSGELPSNSNNLWRQQRGSSAGHMHEDVEEAKKQAQQASCLATPVYRPYRRPPRDDDVDDQKRQAKQAQSDRIQLLATLPSGKTITLDTNVNDSINDLKKNIENKVGIDSLQHTLLFNGRNLDQGTRTLRQCGIGNHDTVGVLLRLCGGNGFRG